MSSTDIEKLAILDFGSQYGKLIDRKVRELKVCSELLPFSTSAKTLVDDGYKAIIISGGPNSVYAADAPAFDSDIFTCGIPVLGICYGFQLLNKFSGGRVGAEAIREDAPVKVEISQDSVLFRGLQNEELVLMTHGDSVTADTVGNGLKVISKNGLFVAGVANEEKKLYGVQFHPEVDLTRSGKKMLENFLYHISNFTGSFTVENREQACIAEIKQIVGDKKALVMVSGGVDSTVCAALLTRALGPDRVTAIHIDNGFMRYRESEEVEKALRDIDLKVHVYDYTRVFLTSTENNKPNELMLDQVVEPELKRRIIGNTFIRVKDLIMDELNLKQEDYFLAQGTLRPDLIESASAIASGAADTIKTHHNDTELVRQLRKQGKVIEPLKDFHKDEVRQLGRDLGLPEELISRHPFPGPGLAIRILCAEKEYRCNDFAETEELLKVTCNLSLAPDRRYAEWRSRALSCLTPQERTKMLQQEFDINPVLLPIKSVGVQGDARTYSYVVALSCDIERVPWINIAICTKLIPMLFRNINRVTYALGCKVQFPIMNITRTTLVPSVIQQLQIIDKIANDVLYGRNHRINHKSSKSLNFAESIQQMPVVLIPVDFDREDENSYRRSVVIRPFITNDFMTGIAAVPPHRFPEDMLYEMERRIIESVPGISRVLLDLTNKPPGTTEWE